MRLHHLLKRYEVGIEALELMIDQLRAARITFRVPHIERYYAQAHRVARFRKRRANRLAQGCSIPTVFNAHARSRVPPRIFDSLFQPVVAPKDFVVRCESWCTKDAKATRCRGLQLQSFGDFWTRRPDEDFRSFLTKFFQNLLYVVSQAARLSPDK